MKNKDSARSFYSKINLRYKSYIIEIAIWCALTSVVLISTFGLHYYFVVHKNTYDLQFTDIDGIIKGSPVRLMGVVVGHVRNLHLKDGDISVQIVITKKGVKIPDGSRATVEFTGIIGSKSIEIMPPETSGDFDGIITQNPVRIKEFFDAFDIMNQALRALLNGAVKIATEENLKLLKVFSKDPDFSAVDEASDKTEKIHKKSSEKIQHATKILDDLNKNLDKFIKP